MHFVSVIINCHNGEQFLADALESALAQTYEKLEVVFWDNASSDSSWKIASKFTDKRIKKFFSKTKTTLYCARNLALEKCSGDIIAFLDVDDLWHPEKLAIQLREYSDPDVGMVYSDFWVFDVNSATTRCRGGRRLPSGYILDDLIKFYEVGMLTLSIRKSFLVETKLAFNPAYTVIGDFDLVLRASSKTKIVACQDRLATYRVHNKSVSATGALLEISEMLAWLQSVATDKVFGRPLRMLLLIKRVAFMIFKGLLRCDRYFYVTYLKKLYELLYFSVITMIKLCLAAVVKVAEG